MSLDINLTLNGETIAAMNWLRNPYGLERWAHGNLTHLMSFRSADLPMDLWQVCNEWNYGKSAQIDRPMFKRVIDAYWQVIQRLDHAYFWFDAQSYQQFTQRAPCEHHVDGPHFDKHPQQIEGMVTHGNEQKERIGLPMEPFKESVYAVWRREYPTLLEQYQAWFAELVLFAEKLQDTQTVFYCSN